MFQLYTDFAEPLGLFESQLTILHASDHRDAQMVTDIWNALLLKGTSDLHDEYFVSHRLTLPPTSTADRDAEDLNPQQRYQPFQDLVVRLGKRFYPSHAAFPTSECQE